MAQHVDAAAGSDPYVCFKAVEEAKQLERDDKAMSFKRVSTQLRRRRRSKELYARPPTTGAWKTEAMRVPPPRSLIPSSWVAGPKFKAAEAEAEVSRV
jgi:hypothetical protein